MMQIHQRIKKERVKRDLSEEELANRLGIKRSTYQYWETSTPSIDKVKAVAKALGLNENYFFVTNDEENFEISSQNDENIGNNNAANDESHGTRVPGIILNGNTVLVEAKDLTASYERLIEEKERIIKLMEAQALKAETREKEYLEIIKGTLIKLESNSKEIVEEIEALTTEVQAEHAAMMNSIDVAARLTVGTTAAAAGTVEIASEREHQSKGKKSGIDKKAGAGKQG